MVRLWCLIKKIPLYGYYRDTYRIEMFYDSDIYGCGEIGEFGKIYRQFYHQPIEAIRHLRSVQDGECIGALYRPEIGDIDIIWGEVTDPIKHKGYGLAHIIDKHGDDIESLGYSVEQFISAIVEFSDAKIKHTKTKIVYEGDNFRYVIQKIWNRNRKIFLLTAFNLK